MVIKRQFIEDIHFMKDIQFCCLLYSQVTMITNEYIEQDLLLGKYVFVYFDSLFVDISMQTKVATPAEVLHACNYRIFAS